MEEIVNGANAVPVIVFTGSVEPTPVSPKLRGVTADAAELVHLIVDVAERR